MVCPYSDGVSWHDFGAFENFETLAPCSLPVHSIDIIDVPARRPTPTKTPILNRTLILAILYMLVIAKSGAIPRLAGQSPDTCSYLQGIASLRNDKHSDALHQQCGSSRSPAFYERLRCNGAILRHLIISQDGEMGGYNGLFAQRYTFSAALKWWGVLRTTTMCSLSLSLKRTTMHRPA